MLRPPKGLQKATNKTIQKTSTTLTTAATNTNNSTTVTTNTKTTPAATTTITANALCQTPKRRRAGGPEPRVL